MSPTYIRLNKFISHAGVCARREADQAIAAGWVTVNGQKVTQLGTRVDRQDEVRYKGRLLSIDKWVYVLLNKPKDCITTARDPENRRTVMQLVKRACEERIYPVGRLDRHTTGLLLLTNDGQLAQALSHPSGRVQKLYHITLNRPIQEADYAHIQAGVRLADGLAKVDELAIVDGNRRQIGMTLHIGRNRIIRRIFAALGYEVIRLDRVMYAQLTKKDLPRGKWRMLTDGEVRQLKQMAKVRGLGVAERQEAQC